MESSGRSTSGVCDAADGLLPVLPCKPGLHTWEPWASSFMCLLPEVVKEEPLAPDAIQESAQVSRLSRGMEPSSNPFSDYSLDA